MSDMFDNPGSATGLDFSSIEGRLLLIKPLALETGINTSLGEKDAVRADITVLDGPDSPEEHRDILIFPKVLQGQVKANIGTGRMNLGRLGKGTAKPGQQAPWKLGDPTDADKDAARAHLAKSTQPPF
ncbi:hypothetical protein [Nocardia thailandica]|uniref:hypothetical protein n=1 Tax=Nocardia thailandica TaxID=257275 RepID=UPI0002E04118|nr:hypothetical protein [Nocardia thailandica]